MMLLLQSAVLVGLQPNLIFQAVTHCTFCDCVTAATTLPLQPQVQLPLWSSV